MDLTGFGSVADLLKSAVDRIWPDKTKAIELKQQVDLALMSGQLKELELIFDNAKGQLEINKEEAKNPSLFVSGWRPFIGWVCGSGLAYEFLLRPLLIGFSGADIPMPEVPMGDLLALLGGLLGLGALRTAEKVKGVARI